MNAAASILAMTCVLQSAPVADPPPSDDAWPGTTSTWQGFTRHDWSFEGRGAIVVEPHQPLRGRPWVWRARFFGHEPQTDVALLERGFHLAYADVSGLYGNEEAVNHWLQFHTWLVETHAFSPKPVLEAMSRGALIALAFASAWPDRVAAMYLDAPVCDLRSWPGGFGKGKGSPADWAKCLVAHGLDDASAKADDGLLARLGPLVDGGVEVLSVVGLDDAVVPVSENTTLLANAIHARGGVCRVIEKPGVKHHPHSLRDPKPIVDFLVRCAMRSGDYADVRRGFPGLRGAIARGSARIAFLGGSITAMQGWRDHVKTWLRTRHPDVEWHFVDAGIPSFDSSAHAFRLAHDVLRHGPPDLVFVEAAVNDLHNGRSDVERIQGMEGVVRHLRRAHPSCDTAMLHFIDPSMFAQYNAGQQPPTVQSHELVARHYDVASLHLAREVHDRIRVGEFTWADDFRNLHPSPFGHEVYARSIQRLIEVGLDTEVASAAKLPPPLEPTCFDHGTFVEVDATTRLEGFQTIQAWRPSDRAGTRPGYVDVPMLVAEQPGASCSLTFEGRAIGLLVAAGPDAGTVDVFIDDEPRRTVDLFTRWSGGLHLPWTHVLATDLSPGTHTVRIEVADQRHDRSVGHAVRIARWLVNR